MPYRRLHYTLAPLLAVALAGAAVFASEQHLITPSWFEQAGLPVHRQSVPVEGGATIDLSIASHGDSAAIARLGDTASRALKLYVEWLGPFPATRLTVVDLPWGIDAPGAAYPELVATRVHWIAPARDLVAERALIAAIARQFWSGQAPGDEAWFREALAIYTATRGIHAVLEGRNFAAPRFLGGFISIPLRSLLMSPSPVDPRPKPGRFDEVLAPDDAPWRFAPSADGRVTRRAVDALRTLERMIGWPATQQALAELRARAAGNALTPDLLGTVLAEQRGVTMTWFIRDVVRGSEVIDYAVGGIRSEASAGTIRTAVTVERGPGMFAGTDSARAAGTVRLLPVLVRFEDGSETRAFVDGRDERSEIAFDGRSAARSATIDPDLQMLIDANRSNNMRFAGEAPPDRTGVRLVMNWMIWLQNAMLTYSAIS